MKNDKVLNITVIVTTVALVLLLAPGLRGEAGRPPGGGSGETVVAGEVILPPGEEPDATPPATREVAAAAGERFEVILGYEPGEGCRWELAGPLDPGLADLLGRECREDAGSPSGWVEAWRFEAVGPGEGFVNLACLRPGSPYPLRTETLHLVVAAP
jgi:hypothetical protein